MAVPANVLPSDYSPSTVLQFSVLRDPQKYPAAALVRRFVRFDWNSLAKLKPPPQKGVRLGGPVRLDLLSTLAAIQLAQPPSLELMITAVQQFSDPNNPDPDYIDTPAQLFALFADFTLVYEWLTQQQFNATVAGLQTEIEQAAGLAAGKLSTYVKEPPFSQNNLILWENFVALTILPTNGALTQQLTNTIRMNWIIQKIVNNDPELQTGQDIYEAARATILLPTQIFPLPSPAAPVPLYRLYNTKNNDHFYTTNANEKDQAIALNGYAFEKIEGLIFPSQVTGSIPLYRLVKNCHFYTTDPNEKQRSINQYGYKDEGITGYVFPGPSDTTTPLYRLYLQSTDSHFYTIDKAEAHNAVVNIGFAGEFVACYIINNNAWPGTKGKIKPCFIADFKTVQTQLLLYAKGEIAQINNLMPGETNSHVVRNYDRLEQVVVNETDTTTTNTKETQETDKNELSVEATQIMKSDLKLDVGVNVSANFPAVSIQAKTGFNYQNSRETSNKSASKISKDIMNRALSSITQTVRQQTTVTTIHETEDTNTHGQDNTKSKVPVSAIYRWVDKYYLATLVNYGPRTILDMVIPEPAAFYIYARSNEKKPNEIIVKNPIDPALNTSLDPTGGLKSFKDIFVPDETLPPVSPPGFVIGGVPPVPGRLSNWEAWVAYYGATGVTPPPPQYKTVGISYARADKDDGRDSGTSDKLVIDPGYEAVDVAMSCSFYEKGAGDYDSIHTHGNCWVSGQMGDVPFDFSRDNLDGQITNTFLFNSMNKESGIIPVSFRADSKQYAFNAQVRSQRTSETFDQWRITTYNAIQAGYQAQLQAYQEWLKGQASTNDSTIIGNNPDDNREIEKLELKKSAIEVLTAQRFESFQSMQGSLTDPTPPEFDFDKAEEEGKYSRFFEDAIEWSLISYMFYPYFWGRKENWTTTSLISDPTDPLFTKFLQAGAARVIVPIRQNFEPAICLYLSHGRIWDGGDVPTVDSELYISITDEMKEAAGHFSNTKIVDQWTLKVPTNFVIIDDPGNTAVLPDNSMQLLGRAATIADLTTN